MREAISSMTVTLTPYLITDTGKQTPLATITYDIDIPLSPIDLATPDNPYKIVSTAMYTIVFYVNEGSTVTINGTDYSDLVNTEGGKVSYNATVQPVGENVFNISVRSQYCRENSISVTLYREKQEIPLDLSSDIYSRSNSSVMTVRATTLPGAVVNVLSPYSDLDISSTDSDGSFTFKALFDKIGDNTIIITADYPGKKQTRVEYTVYYVPSIDVYSRKACASFLPLFHHPKHRIHHIGVELRSFAAQQFIPCLRKRNTASIRPVAGHCVVGVCHR